MIDFFLFDKKPLFNELDFQNNILKIIFNNISIDQLNNLCIYGMPGSGKSTNMYAFLATILDKNIYNLKKKLMKMKVKLLYTIAVIIILNLIHLFMVIMINTF